MKPKLTIRDRAWLFAFKHRKGTALDAAMAGWLAGYTAGKRAERSKK